MAVTTEYLSGGRIQGRSDDSELTAIAQTSWKVIARATMNGDNADLDTGTGNGTTNNCVVTENTMYSTPKDNIMILAHIIPSTSGAATTACDLTFNDDDGDNYIKRFSSNGGADSEGSATSLIDCRYNSNQDSFIIGEFRNVAGEEKLGFIHSAHDESDAGSGSAPDRREILAKWVGDGGSLTQIKRVKFNKGSFANIANGSELIVLGCDDDEADSGTNFWQELETTTTTATGDLVDSGVFTAKKYIMVKAYGYQSGDSIIPALQMGNSTLDTGSNYSRRMSVNSATDSSPVTGQTSIATTSGAGYLTDDTYYIINKSDKEKLVINEGFVTGSGTGTNGDRQEIAGKWANASAQANRIGYLNVGGGSSTFGIGSQIRVWGSD